MGQVGLRRTAGIDDDPAQTSAAHLLNDTHWQRGDMPQKPESDVCRDTERRQMRAHQPNDVNEHRQRSEAHRPPAPV